MQNLPIALDAMGGDNAPESVIDGAAMSLRSNSNLKFILFGDESKIAPLLELSPELANVCKIVHTDCSVPPNEKPVVALRKLKNSSMRLAINAVKDGEASAIVSSGNTGALMATSKFVFKSIKGIDRPALTALMPAIDGKKVVVLDLGANVECDEKNLLQFAVMGDAYAKTLLDLSAPKIALLNVGSEDMKGHESIQNAHAILKQGRFPLEYHGFVEGDDILQAIVDVVVVDGFAGNVALKMGEGVVKVMGATVKKAVQGSLLAKIGYFLAKKAIMKSLQDFNPSTNNGAIMLGLNGIAVKSHGGADGIAFANAIKVAVKLVEGDINNRIIEELSQADIIGS